MLTPDEVNGYAGLMAAPWDELSDRILRDMVRRIVKAGGITTTAQWQSYRAEALGASRAYLLRQMNQIVQQLGPQEATVFAQAMKQAYGIDLRDAAAAGRTLTPLGESEEAQQILQSGYRRTMNTLYNLTRTRAVMGNQNLLETTQRQLAYHMDMAHADALSGAFSSDDSARRALNELAAKGVGAITYPSGHVDTLDVVVLRATRTGINQTAGEITRHNADVLGCDLMELDAHVGARTGDGGQNLTNDIAFGLRTPMAAAEKIKIKHGAAIAEMVRPDEYIEVPSVGGREPRRLSRQVLAEICEPRMEEILTLLDQELVRSGLKNMIGAGVVLTGGTALIQGCQELGEQVFNLPTRIGYPRNVGGLKDMVNSPKFATAMGLLRFGAEKEGMEQKFRIRSDGNVFNSILSRMKKWFSEIS